MKISRLISYLLIASGVIPASAAIRYVNAGNATPASPYTTWSSAATQIQQAIDAADPGDEILVTNGVYQAGGRTLYSVMNRVALDRPVTVRSVNGPNVTRIEGVPDIYNAVRCAYLSDGAVLSGFTLTNGSTATFAFGPPNINYGRIIGGGVWCEHPTAVVSNCVITTCHAEYLGGGAAGGILIGCTLTNNNGFIGGGSYANTLIQCTVVGNSSSGGGGAQECILRNCIVMRNSAFGAGGAGASTLNNCAVIENESYGSGGGVAQCNVTNCTVVGNRAADSGGGAYESFLANSIVYYNFAASQPNVFSGSAEYSCTTPLAPGQGNFASAPALADLIHLNVASPCRGAGLAASVSGIDIDGEAWLSPPSVGCDEFYAGGATGPLSVTMRAGVTNFAGGYLVDFSAQIVGRASANRWDFGDGTFATNAPYVSHAWSAPGDYTVTVTVYNDTFPAGMSATTAVHVGQPFYYVRVDSSSPAPPYASWNTAADNIQSAVDAAGLGATIVVSNGVYQTGGRVVKQGITNRVAVDKVVTVRSVNGPSVTAIVGYQTPGTIFGTDVVRCVYLTNGAALFGFTVTNGSTVDPGPEPPAAMGNAGGIWCDGSYAFVSNCVVVRNWGGQGGGVYGGTVSKSIFVGNVGYSGGAAAYALLDHCLITGNFAYYYGAGANGGVLNHCTVVGNIATNFGGGTMYGTANNSLVYNNQPDNSYSSSFNYSCTTPDPGAGSGNITNAPLFANEAAGDLRPLAGSPVINAGNGIYTASVTDLDGNPRAVDGTPDIGAYEFQTWTPVQFLSANFTNGNFQTTFTGGTNGAYKLWTSTNLVDWTMTGSAQSIGPGLFRFIDSTTGNSPRKFYRAGVPR